MAPLSPISAVRSDNLKLVEDAETVANIWLAYAGMLHTASDPIPAPSRLATFLPLQPREERHIPLSERIEALAVGEATMVGVQFDPATFLPSLTRRFGGKYRAIPKGGQWIVERTA